MTKYFVFLAALIMLLACGGDEADGPDTSLTIDQIVGTWRIDAVDVIKDTCKFPNSDLQAAVGIYAFFEKIGASQIQTYECDTEADCSSKSEQELFDFSKGIMTCPAAEGDMRISGDCRFYADLEPRVYTFTSATDASEIVSFVAKFEGDCAALKASTANDSNDPDRTMGDFEGCQLKTKRTMSKQ